MKIIKVGDERLHQHSCRNCLTIFEFEQKEAKMVDIPFKMGYNPPPPWSYGKFLYIDCPQCHNECRIQQGE